MWNKFYGLSVACASVALAISVGASTSQAAEAFYKGKTITVLVGLSAGGGTDRGARAFTRFMGKHIPGNPGIIVKNMTGAGGQKALNFLYEKSRRDGLTLFFGAWNAPGALIGLPGVRSDPAKLEMVGSGGGTYLSIIRTNVAPGIKASKDIAKTNGFIMGGIRPTVVLDMLSRMSFDIMGVKYRYVPGYRGQAKLNPAIQSNEIQAVTTGYQGYRLFYKDTLLKNGKAIVAWHHPPYDGKGNQMVSGSIAGAKSFLDVYQEIHGKKPSGTLWDAYRWTTTIIGASTQSLIAPPGTSKQALADLRKAHVATRNDPDFKAAWAKQFGIQLSWLKPGEDQRILKTYKNVKPEIVGLLKKYLKKVKRKR